MNNGGQPDTAAGPGDERDGHASLPTTAEQDAA
jgi:hypothetical protein